MSSAPIGKLPTQQPGIYYTTWDDLYLNTNKSVISTFVERYLTANKLMVYAGASYQNLVAKIRSRFPDPTEVWTRSGYVQSLSSLEEALTNIDAGPNGSYQWYRPKHPIDGFLYGVLTLPDGTKLSGWIVKGGAMELFPYADDVAFRQWVQMTINQPWLNLNRPV